MFGTAGLNDYGSARLNCKIWSLSFLQPGAIQGKGRFKFCHLATLVTKCKLTPPRRPGRRRRSSRSAAWRWTPRWSRPPRPRPWASPARWRSAGVKIRIQTFFLRGILHWHVSLIPLSKLYACLRLRTSKLLLRCLKPFILKYGHDKKNSPY